MGCHLALAPIPPLMLHVAATRLFLQGITRLASSIGFLFKRQNVNRISGRPVSCPCVIQLDTAAG